MKISSFQIAEAFSKPHKTKVTECTPSNKWAFYFNQRQGCVQKLAHTRRKGQAENHSCKGVRFGLGLAGYPDKVAKILIPKVPCNVHKIH